MATAQLGAAVRHIREMLDAAKAGEQTDGALLRAFLGRTDQAAFEALVRRHGPMVLRVCQRTLGDAHDAEDALQATFLVLAQKAASIRRRESLASWLHGVAYRMATHAKRAAARRHTHEAQVRPTQPQDPAVIAAWQELQVLLDEEIQQLSPGPRAAFVYCCLENKSATEAAQQLGVEEATVRKRLSRARTLLQDRLSRRGASLTAVLAAAALGTNAALGAVPPTVIASTAKAATLIAAGKGTVAELVSTKVAALTEGLLKAMFLTKLRATAIAVLLTAALAGTGSGVFAYRILAADNPGGIPAASAAEAPNAKDATALSKLIGQLGSDRFVDREKAARELDRIGAPALDALRRATKSEDPECKRRAEELVQKIEKRVLEADLLAPKRVRLVYEDTPLAEAVSDFANQSGYELTLSDPEGKLKERAITLDTGNVTFWQALDLFCLKAGVIESLPQPAHGPGPGYPPLPVIPGRHPNQLQPAARPLGTGTDGKGIVLTDGKAVPVPTDGSTSVRVRAGVLGKTANGLFLTMQITPEPKLRGVDIAAVQISRAIDNKGQSLEPVVGENDFAAPRAEGELPPLPVVPRPPLRGTFRHDPALVRLKAGPTAATSLSELSGRITIRLPQAPEAASNGGNLDVPFALKNISLP